MLIHCNKGKHRTGLLVGCLRKVQQWSIVAIQTEYRLHSFPKHRFMDEQVFIIAILNYSLLNYSIHY